MRKAAVLALLAGLAGAGAQAAPGEGLEVRVTHEVSTGGYDAPSGIPVRETTLQLRYAAEHWFAQAEVPWLRVAGAGDGPLAPGVRAAEPEQGVGDVRLKLTLPLRESGRDRTGWDLVFRFKSGSGRPVGGLDTGDAGQSVRLALLRPLGSFSLFGHLGWRRGGDLPGTDPGRQAWHAELGAFRLLASRVEAGAYVDVRQRMATNAPLREATAYAALDEGRWRWHVYVSRSLVRADAQTWAGVNLQAAF